MDYPVLDPFTTSSLQTATVMETFLQLRPSCEPALLGCVHIFGLALPMSHQTRAAAGAEEHRAGGADPPRRAAVK